MIDAAPPEERALLLLLLLLLLRGEAVVVAVRVLMRRRLWRLSAGGAAAKAAMLEAVLGHEEADAIDDPGGSCGVAVAGHPAAAARRCGARAAARARTPAAPQASRYDTSGSAVSGTPGGGGASGSY